MAVKAKTPDGETPEAPAPEPTPEPAPATPDEKPMTRAEKLAQKGLPAHSLLESRTKQKR